MEYENNNNNNNSVAELQKEILHEETKFLWVFGYGSLCWKPGFSFHKAITGYVKGYQRRFWQGNTTHRGTEDKPGRVATLIEDKQGTVHGVAYAIKGEAAIPYLNNRECKLGSYITQFAIFHPLIGEPFNVLLYIARPNNPLWLGEADDSVIANHIVDCQGASGHNVEYLVRLAKFMREIFPDHHDQHLFNLEKEVLQLIELRKLHLDTLMGNGDGCITFVETERASSSTVPPIVDNEERTDSFQYTARIQEKKLKCLNI